MPPSRSWFALFALAPVPVFAQYSPGHQNSANIRVLSHVPLGRIFTVADIEIEQELSRPYVYVARSLGKILETGFDILSVKDPRRAEVIYSWRVEDGSLRLGNGCLQNKYFKLRDRYYDVQACQFDRGSPDVDLGAVVFDVTGLPDPSTVKELGRIRAPDTPVGFHNIFTYKHSDGRVLLFATTRGLHANVYDMEKFLARAPDYGLAGRVPLVESPYHRDRDPNVRRIAWTNGYHDFYVGYDPATRQDKFYGAAGGGSYVYDVTRPEEPRLLTSVTGVAGMISGHTFTPTPDGRYAIIETEYQYAPLRIFDLKPGLTGEVKTISRPIGAWTARWQGLAHNTEVRWPYVFVSAYEDGLYVFNWMDPANPYTVGYHDTYEGPHERGRAIDGDAESAWSGAHPELATLANGAFGVDVRNADGLIVISDEATGFWAFKMDGFDGWNGHQWGMPNVSSVQDWDNGPDGAAKPAKAATS